jgi:hypothetical protein
LGGKEVGGLLVILLQFLPFPIQFFCQLHTPQLLFVLDGKEVGRLLLIILQFKENIEKQIEYNLPYLLAKVRTT